MAWLEVSHLQYFDSLEQCLETYPSGGSVSCSPISQDILSKIICPEAAELNPTLCDLETRDTMAIASIPDPNGTLFFQVGLVCGGILATAAVIAGVKRALDYCRSAQAHPVTKTE